MYLENIADQNTADISKTLDFSQKHVYDFV